jgi:hypothetical protein
LYRCGPVGNQHEPRPPPREFEIQLYDPRNYSWYPNNGDAIVYDKVLLRPIILDILSILSLAEEKYRVYDGNIPDTPIPGYIYSFLLFVWLFFFTYALLAVVYVSHIEDRFFTLVCNLSK